MSEDEVRAAMERCLDGFREAEQHHRDAPGDEPDDQALVDTLSPTVLKVPEGWKMESPATYIKKRMRLVATGTAAEVTISISVRRNGVPGHPTDDQCQRALKAFGFEEAQEESRTLTARYFKCDQQQRLD